MGWLLLSVNVSKRIFGLAVIAQLGECKTEDLEVLGSIPGRSMVWLSVVIMIKYMSELFEFEIFLNHSAMSSTKSNSKK